MKFDCIIGNPPFNDATSSVKHGTTGHSMTKQLHLQFLNRSINGVEKGGDVAIICPANKWWIGKGSDNNIAEYTKVANKQVYILRVPKK
jgi:tRNA1(Val) A37 N6-methylase TrmN6